MLKLDVEWTTQESTPEDGDGVTVELVTDEGTNGWPVYRVFAQGSTGAEAGPRLWAWLVEVYEVHEDLASELASQADWV